MTAWSMQRKAKGVMVLFSVYFFLFLWMFVKEFKIFLWAEKAFCFSEWEQLLGMRALSLIPAGALVNFLQDLPTQPGHVKIKFIYPNISGLRLVAYIFEFILLIFFATLWELQIHLQFFPKCCSLIVYLSLLWDDILNYFLQKPKHFLKFIILSRLWNKQHCK